MDGWMEEKRMEIWSLSNDLRDDLSLGASFSHAVLKSLSWRQRYCVHRWHDRNLSHSSLLPRRSCRPLPFPVLPFPLLTSIRGERDVDTTAANDDHVTDDHVTVNRSQTGKEWRSKLEKILTTNNWGDSEKLTESIDYSINNDYWNSYWKTNAFINVVG